MSRLAPSDEVETEAAVTLAATLAAGPTCAFGAVRRMLRQSFETGLSDQLDAERESIVAASSTDDAQEELPRSSPSAVHNSAADKRSVRTTTQHQSTAKTAAGAVQPAHIPRL